MLKTLFATSLLLFSCSSGSLKQEAIEQPYQSNIRELDNNYNLSLNGAYNFRDTFDYGSYFTSSGHQDIVLDLDRQHLVSFASSGPNINSGIWNLYQISFDWLNGGAYIDIEFFIYNGVGQTSVVARDSFVDNLTSFTGGYNDVIFYFNQSSFLSGDSAFLFYTFFTPQDNYLTKTYSGYYNFQNNLSAINNPVAVFGPITFKQNLYLGFSNLFNGAIGGPSNLIFTEYDVENDLYRDKSVILPITTDVNQTNNLLFNGVKMTISTYDNLRNVGVFAYVRDTTFDNADFKDLLFGVMDSPLYFIHMLLSFELLGVNLYVAFASLLTVLLIIVCIRKFL